MMLVTWRDKADVGFAQMTDRELANDRDHPIDRQRLRALEARRIFPDPGI